MAISTSKRTQKLDPKVERLLQLIVEARQARSVAISTRDDYEGRADGGLTNHD